MRTENRNAERMKSGSAAWVRMDKEFSVRPCVIVDMSSSGVRLVIEEAHAVGMQFNLLLRRDASPGQRCRVMWRHDKEIGAEFF